MRDLFKGEPILVTFGQWLILMALIGALAGWAWGVLETQGNYEIVIEAVDDGA